VPTLIVSLSRYVFFVYNTIFFLVACFVNSSPEVTFQITLVFWPFSCHQVLTQFSYLLQPICHSSLHLSVYLFGNYFLAVVYECNVLCTVRSKIDIIRNIKILMLRCKIGHLIFLALCGLWMLNNVVFIQHLAGRHGIWVFYPLCDIILVFFIFCYIFSYDLGVSDISVSFVVLCYRLFFRFCYFAIPVGLTLLCRVLCLWPKNVVRL
jgi:hypothetical protein